MDQALAVDIFQSIHYFSCIETSLFERKTTFLDKNPDELKVYSCFLSMGKYPQVDMSVTNSYCFRKLHKPLSPKQKVGMYMLECCQPSNWKRWVGLVWLEVRAHVSPSLHPTLEAELTLFIWSKSSPPLQLSIPISGITFVKE